MKRNLLLEGKRVVVFGASGSIGTAVAKEFAAEGARVFLSGRTKSKVEEIVREIATTGGVAQAAEIDALNDKAVEDYLGGIVKQAGGIDAVFNALGVPPNEYGQGKNAVDLPTEEFMVPLTTIVKSWFITAREAARVMAKQHSGTILFLTGSPARGHVEGATSICAAFGAVETLSENLAFQLGSAGVRVVCLRTTANADSKTIQESAEIISRRMNATKDEAIAMIANLNFLKTPASVSDTARAAAFLVSDRARLFTGTVVNSSAGAALD